MPAAAEQELFPQLLAAASATFGDQDRYDVIVAELLDAGGLGEKIVPFLRHAKSR